MRLSFLATLQEQSQNTEPSQNCYVKMKTLWIKIGLEAELFMS